MLWINLDREDILHQRKRWVKVGGLVGSADSGWQMVRTAGQNPGGRPRSAQSLGTVDRHSQQNSACLELFAAVELW